MSRAVHVRVVAAVLMALLFAPMAAALAAPAAQPHGCCKSPVEKVAPQSPEQCCFISSNPGPVPVATAPARTPGSEQQVFVAMGLTTVSPERTTGYVAASEFAPSPPLGPNCSSILRI